MNKFISKDLGKNAVSTYKRASNILDKEKNISKNLVQTQFFLNKTRKKNYLIKLMI